MKTTLDMRPPMAAPTVLRKGQLLRLDGRRGQRITSCRGTLWLTQDDDPNDVVLETGQVHRLEADGPVLIQALGRSCVAVETGEPAPPARRLRWRDAWAWRFASAGAA